MQKTPVGAACAELQPIRRDSTLFSGGEQCEEEGVAEMKCSELTDTPVP